MSLTNYHIDKVILIWNNIPINGYAGDTFIEVERNEDGFTTYVGSLGDVCRTKNLNRTGKITVTLMATAPVNDVLALAAQADEDSGLEFGPILIKDLSGFLEVSGAEAWVSKRPKIERAKESGTIQWVFEVAEMLMHEGGNVI
jgi:hypothetical protein